MHQKKGEPTYNELAEKIKRLEKTVKQQQEIVDRQKKCEEISQFLTQNATDIVFRMSIPDRHFQYISPACEKILGYNVDEFYNTSHLLLEIIHPQWKQYIEKEWKKLSRDEKVSSFEYQVITKNGDTKWLFQRNTIIKGDACKPAFLEGIISDITKRKLAELQLKENEEKFRSLFNNINIGVALHEIITDENNVPVDFVFLDINPTYEKITHLKKNDIIGKRGKEVIPNIEQKWIDAYGKVAQTGEAIEIVDHSDYLDKYWEVKAYSPKKNQFAVALTDITDRRKSEIANQKRYKALIEPLDNTENIKFDEIFKLDDIQKLQDEFAFATGVASIITDTEGKPITKPSNFCELCSNIIRPSEKGRMNCQHSDKIIGQYKLGKPIVQHCLSGGLWDAGTSITVGGKHIANWLIGQVRDKTQTDEKIRQYARQIEVDEEQAVKAFHKVPSMNLEQFKKVAQMLHTLTIQLSTSAYQNLQQARFISEKTKLKNQFEAIFNMSLNMICIADINTATFLKVNPAFISVLGYSEEELLGKPFLEFIHPDDVKPTEDIVIKDLRAGKSVIRFENRYKTKGGGYKWLDWNSHPVPSEGVTYAMAHDVTEQKTAAEELKKSEERYRFVTENIEEIIFMVNSTGELTFISGNTKKLFGVETQIISSLNMMQLMDFFHASEDVKHSIFTQFSDAINRKAKSVDYEFQHKIKNTFKYFFCHERLLYSDDNEYKGAIGVIRDITDRKKFELELKNKNEEYLSVNEELRESLDYIKNLNTELQEQKNKAEESEKQFRQLFENLSQGFALHEMIYDKNDAPYDYRFLLINKSFEKLTGMKSSDFIGKTVKDALPNIEQEWIDNYGKVARTGKQLFFENYSADLGKYYEVVAYSPKKDFFAVVFTDVTKNKLYEKELIEAKEKAEESDRLKSAFLANMSHEIRTPMNGIIGFSELLSEPNIAESKRKFYAEIVQSSSQQLLTIVNDILDISKIETGQIELKPEVVSVNEIIDDTFTFYKSQAQKNNISLYPKKGLPEKESVIQTDATKLKQVLNNLINNALKFTNEGFIEFGYTLQNESGSQNLQFYVKDTGVGIDTEQHKQIFERFRQGLSEKSYLHKGTGLGLAISKSFVELLGGEIRLTSKPGQGTTFYFTLPYNPVYDVSGVEAHKQEEKDIKSTILIVEDEEVNFLFIEEVLSGKPFHLIHAKTGEEAVEICTQNQGIKLILMDIKLPKMDGYQATAKIKEFLPNVPVVAQTAYAFASDKNKARQVGCEGYLAKPIKVKELLDVVEKYCVA